jgi:hypothetical protein
MSRKMIRTWCTQDAYPKLIQTRTFTFAESSIIARRDSMIPEEKHTFFPGNEISGNRLKKNQIFLFSPDSKTRIFWDFLIFLCTVYLSISIPISISYFYNPPAGVFTSISMCYLFDVLVSLNTSYYERGKIISDRVKILKKYLKHWFFIDFLSMFPFELFLSPCEPDSLQSLNLPKDLPRLLLVLKLLKIIKSREGLSRIKALSTDSSFFTISKIGVSVLCIVIPMHWMNCIFNIFYCLSLDSDYLYWPDVREDRSYRYLLIFQRVMQTLTSVGYGDFVVRSTIERLLILFFMVFTSGFFGYFIGQIELIITNSSKVSLYFRTVKTLFLQYCDRNKVPKHVRCKVNGYIRYLMNTYRNQLVQDEDIIDLLSTPLREQVFLFSKGYIVYSVNFFTDLSTPCKRAFGYKLRLRVFGPADIIFNEGELTDELYFIGTGRVSIIHQKTRTIFNELHEEESFGEIAFWTKQQRTTKAVSGAFSELYSLSRFDCDLVLSKMPKDLDKFLSTLRNIRSYGLAFIGISCYLCASLGHIARNCNSFICKPVINVQKYYSKEKRVNTEYTPRRLQRAEKAEVFKRYGILNTFGAKAPREKVFSGNKYLIRKSKEYGNQAKFQSENFMRVLRFVDEAKSAADSSEESERNVTRHLLYDSMFINSNQAKSPIPSISISLIHSERSGGGESMM